MPLFELHSIQVPLLPDQRLVCLRDIRVRVCERKQDGLAQCCAQIAHKLFQQTKVGKRKLEEFRTAASDDYLLPFVLLGEEFVLRKSAWEETAYRRVSVREDRTTGLERVPWGDCIRNALLNAARGQAQE
jgi:hypothetical protein